MAAESGRGLTLRIVRNGVLVVAALLVLVVAVFIGYGRYRLKQFGAGLPGRMGIHVSQESDGVTYSQTVEGRTIFTVHAAKQFQHADGTVTLHDVGIVMYGRLGDRADRIHGSQFEYDQKHGVLKAVGEVYIDVAGPPGREGKGAAAIGMEGLEDDSRTIHIKTSGLTFLQAKKYAETDELVEFQVQGGKGETTGTAVGATYDSDAGVVVLKSAVKMSGLRGENPDEAGSGRPMVLTAARAEMDRRESVIRLETAKVVGATADGAQTVSAEHAVVHTAADGTPERVDAQGRVTLTGDSSGAGQGVVTADAMELLLNKAGQARDEHLMGHVMYVDDDPAKQERAQAGDARIAFDGQGRPVHAVMTTAVQMEEKTLKSERRLNAAKVDLALGGGGKERTVLKDAVASGPDGAMVRGMDRKEDGTTKASGLRADVLTAHFVPDGVVKGKGGKRGGGTHVSVMDGQGKTYVEQVAMDAKGGQVSKDVSTGAAVHADFRQDEDGKVVMTQAVQRGGVSVVREAVAKASGTKAPAGKKSAGPEVQHAKADVASYDMDADVLTMTGGVEVSDAESALFADKVRMEHTTGDSTADGGVRVTYLKDGSTGEPVHVMAGHAVSHKATGVSEFFAGAGGRARMWQGGSSVEAPMLHFDRTGKTLVAKDERGADGAVHTVLEDTSGGDGKKVQVQGADGGKRGSKDSGPVRVSSREMTYSDGLRQVDFRGHVRLVNKDGVMSAQDALVYLSPAEKGQENKARVDGGSVEPGALGDGGGMTLGGRVDHIVATGGVLVEQPGRHATGEKLVYTASDQVFVLTGTKEDPPKIVDQLQGTTSGASLRFRTGDDSVVVSGTEAGSETRRVRTETKVKGK